MLTGWSRFAAERKTRNLFNQHVLTQAYSSCSFLCHVVQLKTFFITFGIFLMHQQELPERDIVSLGIIMLTTYLRRTRSRIFLGGFWLNVSISRLSVPWFSDNNQACGLNFLCSVNAPMQLLRNTGICASSGNPLKRCRRRAKVLLQPKAQLICTLTRAHRFPHACHSDQPLLVLLLIFSLLTTKGLIKQL